MAIDLLGLTLGVFYSILGYSRYHRSRVLGSAMILLGLVMAIGGIASPLREAKAFQYLLAAAIVVVVVTALGSGISWLHRYWELHKGETVRLATLSGSEGEGKNGRSLESELGRETERNGGTGV